MKFNRKDTAQKDHFEYDWNSNGYVGPMFLYISYGFYDAAWQTCVYWFMGATRTIVVSSPTSQTATRAFSSAGAAIIWCLDGLQNPPPYMTLFASCWALLTGSMVIALPVMILKIKNTVPIEEDLKFTHETIEDVIEYKVISVSPKQDAV